MKQILELSKLQQRETVSFVQTAEKLCTENDPQVGFKQHNSTVADLEQFSKPVI